MPVYPTEILGFRANPPRQLQLNVGWDFVELSSERYKTNITDLNYGLSEILKISPKKFLFKGDDSGIYHIGFTAENVISVVPEAASPDDNGKPHTVSVGGLEPVLVNAIKEQQKQIEELKLELKNLKSKL